MRATIQKLHSSPQVCEARTENDLLLVFTVPSGILLKLSDELIVPHVRLNETVSVINSTQNTEFLVFLKENNVHDLRLPVKHGGNRTPSTERLKEA